jgi:hypothetical protein
MFALAANPAVIDRRYKNGARSSALGSQIEIR